MDLQEMMSSGNVSVENLIEQIQDPQAKMLAQMWTRQQQQAAAAVPEPGRNPGSPPTGKMRSDIQDLIQMNRDLIRESRALQAKFLQLQAINTRLAGALGACPCWGQDAACAICSGTGQPGSREIDLAAFTQFIEPVILQLAQPATLEV